jgi:hypothetical protein
MLVQLIYMSAATRPFLSHELPSLLTKTRLKNESLGVSGMLVYHEGSFLQVLEGSAQNVDQLYKHIALDDRHTNCELLLRTFVEQRSFGDWSMGFVNTNEFRNPAQLPGYRDFFGTAMPFRENCRELGMAQKLLLAFRAGEWRKLMEEKSNLLTSAN